MAITPKYFSRASLPGGTGQAMAPISLAETGAAQMGQLVTQAADQIQAAGERIQRRTDLINTTRLKAEFDQQELQEYEAFKQTADLLNPESIRQYRMEQEKRRASFLTRFSGSADAYAQLDASLQSTSNTYSQQMSRDSLNAQNAFVEQTIGQEISALVAANKGNPALLAESFFAVDQLVESYADVLSTTQQMALLQSGHSMVLQENVEFLLDRGQYDAAAAMMDENDAIFSRLSEDKKEQYRSQISAYRQEEGKMMREIEARRQVVALAASKGVPIDPNKASEYIFGTDLAPTPSGLDRTLSDLGLTREQYNDLSLPQRAAIMKIDIPGAEPPDPNKDYYVDPTTGQTRLTLRGAKNEAKPYIESVADVLSRVGSIESQVAQYRQQKSGLAALGVISSYLKMIDDGAVVRDSDIALARQSTPLTQQLKTIVSGYKEGDPIGEDLVNQAIAAAQSFVEAELAQGRAFIEDTSRRSGFGVDQFLPPVIYNDLKQRTSNVTDENVKVSGGALPSPAAGTDGGTVKPGVNAPATGGVDEVVRDENGNLVLKKSTPSPVAPATTSTGTAARKERRDGQ